MARILTPKPSEAGVITADAVYDSMKRSDGWGWRIDALRSARRAGLKVHYVGRRIRRRS